ncbi:MAG: GIY-YIG nuclease family protein [Candidatus Altimarinota bacterium]
MYFTYIIQCNDNTYYTGYTNNLENRLKVHNSGKGAKYTRGRIPVKLIYFEKYENESDARKREIAIKKLSRIEKEKIMFGPS